MGSAVATADMHTTKFDGSNAPVTHLQITASRVNVMPFLNRRARDCARALHHGGVGSRQPESAPAKSRNCFYLAVGVAPVGVALGVVLIGPGAGVVSTIGELGLSTFFVIVALSVLMPIPSFGAVVC